MQVYYTDNGVTRTLPSGAVPVSSRALAPVMDTVKGGPAHEYDCPDCIYLGTIVIPDSKPFCGTHDLYYCPAGNVMTGEVVARYGPEAEYRSWMLKDRLPADHPCTIAQMLTRLCGYAE